MMTLLYNHEMVAIPQRENANSTTVMVDPIKSFGTEYGMFIPITLSAYQFIRWIRRGMKEELPLKSVFGYLIHISNDGEVLIMIADTEDNIITMVPYTRPEFNLLNGVREISEAYNSILEDCTNVSEAVRMVDESLPNGMYEPIIFFVSDWVAHAKEKGYDKAFYHTVFR